MTAIIGGFSGKTLVSIGKGKYAPNGQLSVKIPQDIVVKEFIIVARGTVSATYAGATPKIGPLGVLHGLVSELSISRKGTDKVRSYRGTRQLISTMERKFGSAEGELYKVNSADLSGVVLQGLPTLGTTGQNTCFQESRTVMMENKLSGAWYPTLFSTKDLQTATLNINFNPVASIQDPEDTAAVTSWAADIEIEVFASCSDYLLGNSAIGEADWVQTYEDKEFSGAQNQARHYITPQGMLQGMLITGLHGGNKPFDFENMKKTRIEIKYQGITLCEGTMADYLEIDINKTVLTNRRKGSAYISFLNNMDFKSGLYIAEGKQLELVITTDTALSYSTPVKLVFEFDQIVFKPTAPKAV